MTQQITEKDEPTLSPVGRLMIPSIVLANLLLFLPQVIASLLLVDISLSFDVSVGIAGQIGTAASMLTIGMSLLMSLLSVRFNPNSLILVGLVCLSVSAISCYLAPSFTFLLVAYSLTGLSNATVGPMSHALIGQYFAIEQRPKISGYLLAGMATAFVIGSPLVSFIADWRLTFLVLVFPLALCSLFLAMKGLPARKQSRSSNKTALLGFHAVLANKSALACIVANIFAIIGGAVTIIYVMSFYRQQLLVNTALVSLANVGWSLIYVLGCLIGGRLVNRYGRKTMTVMNALINGSSTLLVFMMPTFGLSLIFLFLISFSGSLRLTAFNSLALEQVPEYRGTMMSLVQLSQFTAALIATALGGFILINYEYAFLGVFGIFVITGATIFHFSTQDPTQTQTSEILVKRR